MKAIMVMFDTLNRQMLPPYGCTWVHAPNFQRLAERCVTFDKCYVYVGSMPCMPARRELHTGRYNFLNRSWAAAHQFGTLLFDLESDPKQNTPIQNSEVEERLCRQMVELMQQNDAPPEQYARIGLEHLIAV